MTINEIKQQLGVESLALSWFVAEDGTQTEWLRNWDNTRRRAILMHKDVDELLQKNRDYANLGIKREAKEGPMGEFTSVVIVAYPPADREY